MPGSHPRLTHRPANCPKCGGQLRKLGEDDVTQTLECVPRSWKIVEHVRERDCQEFRVRAMTMGRKEPSHGTPQSTDHP